jgi:spore germination protein KC
MNNKYKKILIIICILITNLTLLSGCYDSRGIEDLAYVTALGIDIDDNNILSLTFQISIPETSSESGSSQSSKTENTTVQCTSIDSGISLVNSYISKQLNLSHCKALVFSEKIASIGLNPYIDTLSNNVEIRPDCNVIITRCTAKDFIENATPSIETLTARYYEVALKSSEYTGYTTPTDFATFVNDIKNSFIQSSAILGGINTGNNIINQNTYVGIDASYKANQSPIDDINNVETFGTAVFHNDKLVGELSGLETLCFLLITDKLDTCSISVPSPFESNNEIDLSVRKNKNAKITVELINGSPYITVELYLDAHGLTLNDTIDYTSVNDIKLLENSANQYIKTEVTNFLYKTSLEFNSDIVGFGKYTLPKYLTWKDWEDSNWNENYKNSFFNVSVNTSILSGSEFDKSP